MTRCSRWQGLGSGLLALMAMAATADGGAGVPYEGADKLWKMKPPPFNVVAAQPVTVYSESKKFDPGMLDTVIATVRNGLNSDKSFDYETDVYEYPLPMEAPRNASPVRLDELGRAASLAAQRYAEIGLRAPVLHIEDGRFRALLVRQAGDAAAFYGHAVEKVSSPEDAFKRWYVESGPPDLRHFYLVIGEGEAYDKDVAVFPAKAAFSIGHELFHAVQASYPEVPEDTVRKQSHKWITEGIPDAIAPWAGKGVSFQSEKSFDWKRSLASGSLRFGKVLGLRPWDYPLDLRDVPYPTMKIQASSFGDETIRELASYMTSAFWRYIFEDKPKPELEWTALPALMASPDFGKGSTVRDKHLLWTNKVIKQVIPTFTEGLYNGLPAFIAERADYPDQVMDSRRGVFAHPAWLEYMFQDGCPLVTVS